MLYLNLSDIVCICGELYGTRSEVESPDSDEGFVKTESTHGREGIVEVFEPCVKGSSIAFCEEEGVDNFEFCFCDFFFEAGRGRYESAGEDELTDEVVASFVVFEIGVCGEDCLYDGSSLRFEGIFYFLEVCGPKFLADGFEHFDGDDGVVESFLVAIIFEFDAGPRF